VAEPTGGAGGLVEGGHNEIAFAGNADAPAFWFKRGGTLEQTVK
jgi:hypothetical protein